MSKDVIATAKTTAQAARPRWRVSIAVVAALALILLVSAVFRGDSRSGSALPTFPVASGPLTISISEAGTIKSRNLEIIKCEVEGTTAILFLIAEGTQVKKGELLAELDASRLQDQRVDKQITVQNAEANFIRAREQQEVLKNQSQADMAKAELDYQFAAEDLQKYEQGDYPSAKKEAGSRLALAKDELDYKSEKLRQSRALFDRNFISKADVQADELNLKRAQNELEAAAEHLKLLESFTHKRRMAELKSNLDQSRMALERVKRKATADLVQSAAELKAKESEFERQKSQLAKILLQIEKTRIFAPTDGLVVYATTGQTNMRSSAEPLAEGAVVRERQHLIYLPTSSSVMAEVKLHESTLDKIRPGLPVRVSVDALPGRVYSGTLAKIAPLPDGQSMWMNPDMKVFNSEIHLDANDAALRTGMSCRAEIVVEELEAALYIPVQSVLRVNGTPTVYVLNGSAAPEPRAIEIGLDNNRMTHVRSGLTAGELVLLNPPLQEATQNGETKKAAAQPRQPAVTPVKTTLPTPTPEAQIRQQGSNAEAAQNKPNPEVKEGEEPRRPRRNMTPEQREEFRKRMENMTPEERERMKQQWMRRPPGAEPRPEHSPGAGQ